MAKGIYVGVGGTARHVKSPYVGVGGVAHKVKKTYVGVGGVPHLTYSAEPSLINPNLTLSIAGSTGASNPNYALFINDSSSAVEGCNSSLVKVTASAMPYNRTYGAGGNIGNYAIFAGGYSSGYGYLADMSIYDTSLTKMSNSIYVYDYKNHMNGAKNSSYLFFFGGYSYSSGEAEYNRATAINSSLTVNNSVFGGQARFNPSGIDGDTYALFGGGQSTWNVYNNVDAFNTSLTRSNPTALSDYKTDVAGARAGQYYIFAGGWQHFTPYTDYASCDAYDANMVKTVATSCIKRHDAMGLSLGEYAIFAGGTKVVNTSNSGSGTYCTDVEMYDSNLTRTVLSNLVTARGGQRAKAVIGNTGLLAGQTSLEAFQN
jgi:hypothetical protein